MPSLFGRRSRKCSVLFSFNPAIWICLTLSVTELQLSCLQSNLLCWILTTCVTSVYAHVFICSARTPQAVCDAQAGALHLSPALLVSDRWCTTLCTDSCIKRSLSDVDTSRDSYVNRVDAAQSHCGQCKLLNHQMVKLCLLSKFLLAVF